MKKVLSILTLVGLANATSLPFDLIPQIGWVIGKYSDNLSETKEKWSFGGFEIGAKISYNFPDTQFYLEPGMYYTYVEGKFEDNGKEEKGGAHFLKIPVRFLYEVYKDSDFSLKAGLGPYLAYRVDKKEENAEDWDFGLSLGGSLTYMDKIVFDARFDWGLKDLDKHKDFEVKSRAFVIDIGYKLNF